MQSLFAVPSFQLLYATCIYEASMPYTFVARIILKVGGPPLEVTVSANDVVQAEAIIRHQYDIATFQAMPTRL